MLVINEDICFCIFSVKKKIIFNDNNGKNGNIAYFYTDLAMHEDFLVTWCKKGMGRLDVIRGKKAEVRVKFSAQRLPVY